MSGALPFSFWTLTTSSCFERSFFLTNDLSSFYYILLALRKAESSAHQVMGSLFKALCYALPSAIGQPWLLGVEQETGYGSTQRQLRSTNLSVITGLTTKGMEEGSDNSYLGLVRLYVRSIN